MLGMGVVVAWIVTLTWLVCGPSTGGIIFRTS